MSATPPREPEGHATVRRSRPTPCRQPSTEAVRQGAQAASSLMLLHDEWRRGVGRQARQSGGGIVLFCKDFLESEEQVKGTNQTYRPCTPQKQSRTIGRLRCSIARSLMNGGHCSLPCLHPVEPDLRGVKGTF